VGSSGTAPNSIIAGPFALGTSLTASYNDINTPGATGFWNGITAPSGGYTIYKNKPNNGPAIYVANNDSDLINYANEPGFGGTGAFSGITAAYLFLAGATDTAVLNYDFPDIVTDSMVLHVDATFGPSYPKGGTTFHDLSGGNSNIVLTGTPSYGGVTSHYITFNTGVTGQYGTLASFLPYNNFTVEFALQPNALPGTGSFFRNITNGNGYRNDGWYSEFGVGYFDPFAAQAASQSYAPYTLVPATGSVYYMTITYNNRAVNIYRSGATVASGTASFDMAPPTNGKLIGAAPFGQYPSPINFYMLRVYSRVLSSSEIIKNFNATRANYGV